MRSIGRNYFYEFFDEVPYESSDPQEIIKPKRRIPIDDLYSLHLTDEYSNQIEISDAKTRMGFDDLFSRCRTDESSDQQEITTSARRAFLDDIFSEVQTVYDLSEPPDAAATESQV